MSTITRKIKNTPAAWRGLYNELFENGREIQATHVIVEVELFRDAWDKNSRGKHKNEQSRIIQEQEEPTDEEQNTQDSNSNEYKEILIDEKHPDPSYVSELIHFFPFADRLLSKGNRVTMLVKTAKYGNDFRIQSQVEHLLLAQSHRFLTQELRINLDGKPMNKCDPAGIPNVPFFSETNNEEKYSLRSRSSLRNVKVIRPSAGRRILFFSQAPTISEHTVFHDVQYTISKSTQQTVEIESAYPIDEELFEDSWTLSPIVSVCVQNDGWDIPLDALQEVEERQTKSAGKQLLLLYRVYRAVFSYLLSTDNYKRIEDYDIKNKSELKQQFQHLLDARSKSTPFLVKLIWLLNLRNLLDGKELFHPVPGELLAYKRTSTSKRPKINYEWDLDSIKTCYLNAEAYAEGLFQLLENACRYSAAKRGYFCLTTYRVGLSGGVYAIKDHAENAQKLYSRYQNCFIAQKKASPDNIFAKGYRYMLEFYVLDDAGVDGNGIRRQACKTYQEAFANLASVLHYSPSLEKAGSLEVFCGKAADHYGLRVFCKAVTGNDGCYMIESPYEHQADTLYSSRKWENKAKLEDEKQTITQLTRYRCLLPLTFEQDEESDEPSTDGDIFESPSGECPYWTIHMVAADVFRRINWESKNSSSEKYVNKSNVVSKLRDEISAVQKKPESDADGFAEAYSKGRLILTIDARTLGFSDIELLAKALFRQTLTGITEAEFNSEELPNFRVAVLFETENLGSQEFIRIFLSFYDKLSEQDDPRVKSILKRLQLAVCTYKSAAGEARDHIHVGFILSGDDHRSAYLSARNFLYMNFGTSLEFIPTLRYFSHGKEKERDEEKARNGKKKRNGKKEEKNVKSDITSLFRFDLHLSKDSFEKGSGEISNWKQTTPLENSLFLDRMEEILNTPLQEHDREGCRIDGIHMRVNSRLHMNCFYEAELIFRSVGNVYGFAALIAGELLRSLPALIQSRPKDKVTVALVGYEKLSTELVLQIAEWIRKELECPLLVRVIPVAGRKERKWIKLAAYDKEGEWYREKEEVGIDEGTEETDAPDGEVVLISVIPIGCTYSNVYKIRNIAQEKWENATFIDGNDEFCSNFSVIAVNSQLTVDEADIDKRNVTWAFWKKRQTALKKIYLMPQYNNEGGAAVRYDNEGGAAVRYYLPAKADWFSSDITGAQDKEESFTSCHMCQKLSRLSPSLGGKELQPLIQLDNTSTIPESSFRLKDSAGHLFLPDGSLGDDKLEKLKGTFQYGHICKENNHFQFRFDLKQVYSKNKKAVDEWLKDIKIEQNAFHIVIAPSDIEGMPFVGAALREVFHNSLHFLHIDLNHALREDIRLKFSHIAYEYRELRRRIPSLHIRFYYVDEGIVTTQSIARARLLAQMLLSEGGLGKGDSFYFSKVLLLMCRSSFDTLRQFVSDPNQDVEAWITLNFPPYNTLADRCPACNLRETYSLLRKRSATEMVSDMFMRLEEKQKKRTPEEFKRWLYDEILDQHSYYSLLKEWIAVNTGEGGSLLDSSTSASEEGEKTTPEEITKLKAAFRADAKDAHRIAMKRADEKQEQGLVEDDKRKIWFREELEKKTLRGLCSANPSISEERLVKIVTDTVVAERNFRRLYCTQRAYETLVPLTTNDESPSSLEDSCYDAILDLINKKLDSVKKKCKRNGNYSIEAAEWLISYIKVISREQLVRYYHIRVAIVNVMYDLLKLLLYDELGELRDKLNAPDPMKQIYSLLGFRIKNGRLSSVKKKNLCPSLRYELFMTLVHRLSVLQCPIVFQRTYKEAALEYCKKLAAEFFQQRTGCPDGIDYDSLAELPSEESMGKRYVKSIKTATMLTSNDAPAYQLAHEFSAVSEKEGE